MVVYFDDYPVGILQVSGRSPDRSGQVNSAVRGDLRCFDNGEIDLPLEALEHRLRQVGKVHVDIFDFLLVDLGSQSGAALVGRPIGDGFLLARGSSMLAPLEAPLRTLTLKGAPLAWSSRARSARALGISFAAPAFVNPLNATVAPLKILDAASSGLSFG